MNRRSKKLWMALAALSLFVLTGCASGPAAPVQLQHVHGLGFTVDGTQLFVPAHDGFRVYSNGTWQVPDTPKHDYMGYVATDDGFYSSGHPASGSSLPNPLGLVKSKDGGKSLTTLGFQGEIDFHGMGVGFKTHAIYVMNPVPTAKLKAGMHYSLDDGKTWKPSAAQGLTAEPIQIAVHPTKSNVVAVASEGGLFLSTDHGNSFERVGDLAPVTTAAFAPTGDTLLLGLQKLFAYDVAAKQIRELQTPAVGAKDAIGYVAVNPTRGDMIAFATFGKDIHISTDGGQTWKQIASQGKGVSGR